MKILEIVEKILSIGERQFEGEQKTAAFIKDFLEKNKVDFVNQIFTAASPEPKKSKLEIDGKAVKCEATGFISGKIDTNVFLNSLESSQLHLYESNINTNPDCQDISLSNFYFAPSVAIRNSDRSKIKKDSKIKANLKVIKKKYRSENILVGNIKNPEYVFLGHYDCIKAGATDNASGISVMLKMAADMPKLLNKSLFVFCGNEELSYDQPIYWGHGYRVFEKEYFPLLEKAKKVFVVDCVGNAKTEETKDPEIIIKAFPIERIAEIKNKVFSISGSIPKLMQCYHSDKDTISQLKEKYLAETIIFLLSKISI